MTNEMCPRRPKKNLPSRADKILQTSQHDQQFFKSLFTSVHMPVMLLYSLSTFVKQRDGCLVPQKHCTDIGRLGVQILPTKAHRNNGLHGISLIFLLQLTFVCTILPSSFSLILSIAAKRHFQSGRALFLLVEFSRIPCDFRQ